MEQWTLWLLLALIALPVIFMAAATPYLTRRTESFGVAITEEVYRSSLVKRLRARYAAMTAALSILILIGSLLAFPVQDEQKMPYMILTFVVVSGIASLLLYLYNHMRMKRLKQEHGWQQPDLQTAVIDTSFRLRKPTLSNLWFVPHLLVTAATLAGVLIFYDRFPGTLAMQYNLQGEVTRSVDKSYLALLMPVGIQLMMVAVFMLTNTIISMSKQQLDKADAAASLQRSLIFRRSWSVMIVVSGFLMTLLFSFMSLSFLLTLPPTLVTLVPLLITAVIIAGCIWLSLKVGQGGSRLQGVPAGAAATGTGPSDDDRHWKLGVFYFNPADPALFLEKRFGVGWTINMGRPLAWLIAAVPLALAALLIWLTP